MARPWFFVLLALVGCLRAKAQTPPNRYVVFTFEERYKISPHGTKTYYWIQQADSVAAHPLRLAALFLNMYSKDNLDDICQGRPTDLFLVNERTVYAFPAEHLAACDSLQALLSQHRTRLQTIRKSWDNGQQGDYPRLRHPRNRAVLRGPTAPQTSRGRAVRWPPVRPFCRFPSHTRTGRYTSCSASVGGRGLFSHRLRYFSRYALFQIATRNNTPLPEH